MSTAYMIAFSRLVTGNQINCGHGHFDTTCMIPRNFLSLFLEVIKASLAQRVQNTQEQFHRDTQGLNCILFSQKARLRRHILE